MPLPIHARLFTVKVTERFALQNPGFLGIADCYKLTSQKGCQYAPDGRHYPKLVALELRLLLQQIDSRFPKSGSSALSSLETATITDPKAFATSDAVRAAKKTPRPSTAMEVPRDQRVLNRSGQGRNTAPHYH